MNDKPKEKVYAERLDSSKKNREKITKEAIQDHKKENPKTKENKKFKFTKKDIFVTTLLFFRLAFEGKC